MLGQLIQAAPNRVQLVEVIGRIDTDNAHTVDQIVQAALVAGRSVILLDVHSVEYINSAGLRTLVQLFKQIVRRGGRLILINPSENVQKLLELVGLDNVFDIHYDAQWNTAASSARLPAASREICYCH
ncbi:MAG: STAS domain-containing protein [Anaerolineae bacterium]|nr:STAS domain-containing protein [Anaerolineae bacterium]